MAAILSLGIFVLALLAIIYVLSGEIVVRWVIALFRRKKNPLSRAQRISRCCLLGITGLTLGCAAYAYFVEPYWPEVTHVRIASSKLPHSSQPIRIVQISDLHCDLKTRLEGRLPGLIAEQKPDVIVFTGDAVNSPEGLDNLRTLLRALAKIAPTYAVRGNWDTTPDIFVDTDAKELNREAVRLNVKGTEFYLLGMGVHYKPQIAGLIHKAPPDALKVLLYHYPEILMDVGDSQVDVILSGHTHGGQVALPFYGALYIPARFGKLLERGLYVHGQTYLYVNRGIGMEGGSVPRVRFFSRPEITVIDICPR